MTEKPFFLCGLPVPLKGTKGAYWSRTGREQAWVQHLNGWKSHSPEFKEAEASAIVFFLGGLPVPLKGTEWAYWSRRGREKAWGFSGSASEGVEIALL